MKISKGNSKIGSDTLILNITSATDCKSAALGLCEVGLKKCYAMKSERQYPNVLPYRRAQELQFDSMSAKAIVEEIHKLVKRARKPIKYLRVSEAGDFRSQEDVNKLNAIAKLLNLKVYTYTARRDLKFNGLSNNLVINGSGFPIHNNFKAVDKHSSKALKCVGDCRKCKLCTVRHSKTVEVLKH